MAQKQTEPDLQDILVNFSLNCLMEDPKELKNYAASYFNQKMNEQIDKELEIEEQQVEEDLTETSTVEEELSEEVEELLQPEIAHSSLHAVVQYSWSIESLPKYEKTIEQRRAIEDAIYKWPTLMCLSPNEKEQIIDALVVRPILKGDVIMRQFTRGDYFYIVEKGLWDVYITNGPDEEATKVYTYENRGCFGELSLIYNMPRAATIRAVTRGTVWALDMKTFQKILSRPIYLKRLHYEDVVNSLPIFQKLNSYQKMLICDALKTKRYNPGDVIFKEGSNGDGMYIVRKGKVSCTMYNKSINADVEVAIIEPVDYFGELEIITGFPRACTATALELTTLALMPDIYFHLLLENLIPLFKQRFGQYKEAVTKYMEEQMTEQAEQAHRLSWYNKQ